MAKPTVTKTLRQSADYAIHELSNGAMRIMLIDCAGFDASYHDPAKRAAAETELRAIAAAPTEDEFNEAAEEYFFDHHR